MKRKVIKIDEDKCIGCTLCVSACNEGAIGMVDGKAKLLRDDYCDGLGNCLPVCPAGAISFEEREAKPFDAAMVKERMKRLMNTDEKEEAAVKARMEDMGRTGCPGTAARTMKPAEPEKRHESVLPCGCPGTNSRTLEANSGCLAPENGNSGANFVPSQLGQWPVQLKLVPVNAPYFENADLLIAADCCAYSCGNFHNQYMKNKVTVIGCPKLDNGSYAEKLTEIIKNNNINGITVVRMEVPCCSGIAAAAQEAVKNSGKDIKVKVIILSLEGKEKQNAY